MCESRAPDQRALSRPTWNNCLPTRSYQRRRCGMKTLMGVGARRRKWRSSLSARPSFVDTGKDFPLTAKLTTIAMTISVLNVVCERGLSLQNRVKAKARNSLNTESLRHPMKLSMSPEVAVFPYEMAIWDWRHERKRRLDCLYAPTKISQIE